MSQDALAKFIEVANSDPSLQEELTGQTVDAVVTIAAKRGYEITQEELMAVVSHAKELSEGKLSDADLEAVTGAITAAQMRWEERHIWARFFKIKMSPHWPTGVRVIRDA